MLQVEHQVMVAQDIQAQYQVHQLFIQAAAVALTITVIQEVQEVAVQVAAVQVALVEVRLVLLVQPILVVAVEAVV
jgi:hypothetical protein